MAGLSSRRREKCLPCCIVQMNCERQKLSCILIICHIQQIGFPELKPFQGKLGFLFPTPPPPPPHPPSKFCLSFGPELKNVYYFYLLEITPRTTTTTKKDSLFSCKTPTPSELLTLSGLTSPPRGRRGMRSACSCWRKGFWEETTPGNTSCFSKSLWKVN